MDTRCHILPAIMTCNPAGAVRALDWCAYFDSHVTACGWGTTEVAAIADLIANWQARNGPPCALCGEQVPGGEEADGCRDPGCPQK